MIRHAVKSALRKAGLDVSKRDRLAEQIPPDYLRSPYLPPIYRESFARMRYFAEMFEKARDIPGDLVECGVSIGTGILAWSLLTELSGSDRTIYGFDSFQGFPASLDVDRKADGTFQTHEGFYASPPELVMKMLEEGRVSAEFRQNRVRLVRGFFDKTLPGYQGKIGLLHLDCDLYESYVVCLNDLYTKVRPGGIIMFDEYEDETFPGAKRAIDEFFSDKPERLVRYEKYRYVKYHVVKV